MTLEDSTLGLSYPGGVGQSRRINVRRKEGIERGGATADTILVSFAPRQTNTSPWLKKKETSRLNMNKDANDTSYFNEIASYGIASLTPLRLSMRSTGH